MCPVDYVEEEFEACGSVCRRVFRHFVSVLAWFLGCTDSSSITRKTQ